MPITREIRSISDSRRDAERYYRLLLALELATSEIRRIEEEGGPDIDEVLDRLLPDLAVALNAEQAFVAVLREDKDRGKICFELTAVYPRKELRGHRLEWSNLLQQLAKDGRPRVIDPLGQESRDLIAGLEVFDATSAILVRMQVAHQVRVVGICNKANPDMGPYLAADRIALDSIVELVAIGARVGERRRRELEGIQKTSAAISAELDLDELLPVIAERAAEVFDAPATSLMLWDESEENLVIKAKWGLSNEYTQRQHIPREKVYAAAESTGELHPLLTPDLQLEPFGDIDLIKSERLRTVLSAPLRVTDQLIGILNIYSKDQSRQFTPHEIKLSQIFANQATIAIQNARLYESTRRQVQQLSLLLEAGHRITSFRPMQKLQAIIEELRLALDYDVVILYPYDPNRLEFDRPVVSGKLEVETGVGPVKKEKRAIVWKLVRDAPNSHFTSNPAHDVWLAGPFVRREGIHASGFVRLMVDNQVVGLLFVNKRSAHHFSKEEQSTVRLFADQAAHVIHGASILRTIVDSLHQAMDFDIVTLYLYDAKRNELSRPVIGGHLRAQLGGGPVQADSPVWRAMQGEPVHFVEDASADSVLAGPFVQREGVKASGYVRLEIGGQVVGILFVNWRREHKWIEPEKRAVQLFANQAAIAIHNAQQYKTLEENKQQLNALYEAGKAIAKAGLEIEVVLQVILDQAVVVTGAHFGTLQLVEGDDLVFVTAWPLERLEWLRQEIGRMPISGPGITTRAVRENDAQLAPDVRMDTDYVDATRKTGSELAVVLRREGQPIGVLNVEHRQVGGLGLEDRKLLIALSTLAVVALQNAEQYEELERAKNYGLASEAVAWLGLFGANWQHAINQKTFSIGNYVNGLRRWLTKRELPLEITTEVLQVLDRIEEIAESTRAVQFTSQVPAEMPGEAGGQTMIDHDLPTIIDRWCSGREDVDRILDLNCPGVKVGIAPQWLKVATEKLINNALKAMPTGGQLTVATRLVDDIVHITIKDTGHGIPDFARPYFLKRVVPRRKGESGTGMGALIARFVALSHGGGLILIKSRSGRGTELLMTLPVAMDENVELCDGGGK